MTKRTLTALLIPSLLGCGSSEATVSGTVTVNGEPLRSGYVTLFPVHGAKGTRGAPVNNGQFTLKKISPGPWKALISETPEVQAVPNSTGPATLAIAPTSWRIWPETTGNQPIVEIARGRQTLDFDLQCP